MGTLETLKKSISSMTDAELQQYIREIRASRRAGKAPGSSTSAKAKKASNRVDLTKLSQDDAKKLLEMLGEG